LTLYTGSHLGPVMGPVLILVKYVFCDKYCVRSGKYVSIVVKIKCAGNMSDICDKFNFIINYTHFIKKHTYIKIFETCDGTIP
jgi:hypothetical protein